MRCNPRHGTIDRGPQLFDPAGLTNIGWLHVLGLPTNFPRHSYASGRLANTTLTHPSVVRLLDEAESDDPVGLSPIERARGRAAGHGRRLVRATVRPAPLGRSATPGYRSTR
jgi:hypothetical protein